MVANFEIKFCFQVFQANGKLKLKSVVDGRLYLEDEIPERFDDYVEHYKQCYERCVRLETSLTYLENTTGFPYFPAQIGRKPAPLKSPSAKGKENIMVNKIIKLNLIYSLECID